MVDFVILLVEDEADDILLIQRALSTANLVNPLRIVRDGEEAIAYLSGLGDFADRARYPLPSLLLLDLKLPRKSGLEVLEWVRQSPVHKLLPVVILTSSAHSEDMRRAYALGVNSYLIKPVGFDGLLEMVKGIGMYWMILNKGPESKQAKTTSPRAVPPNP